MIVQIEAFRSKNKWKVSPVLGETKLQPFTLFLNPEHCPPRLDAIRPSPPKGDIQIVRKQHFKLIAIPTAV